MKTNIYRLLSNMRKNPYMHTLIGAINKKFPSYELGANTPFPNQALPTAKNLKQAPKCIYFDEYTSKILENIRNWAQYKSEYRKSIGLKDKSIEFVCTGYLDHSGDIVINNIIIPLLDNLRETCKTEQELNQKFFGDKPSKDINIDILATYYDYLRTTKLGDKDSIGVQPVALLGRSMTIQTTPNHSENCSTIGELARAIVPGDVEFNQEFISGILNICPKEIVQTPNGNVFKDGSLECAIIENALTNQNTAKPTSIQNITRAMSYNKDHALTILPISKSYQPLDNLPIPSEFELI